MYEPQIGCTIDELDTPALCLDLDRLEANIARMAATCREHGVDWRPHSKAHKSPDIAKLLLAAGAIGVTCAKLGEAEVMAEGGIRDLLIANQIVGPIKARRLAELCKIAEPIVALDHVEQIGPISSALEAAGTKTRAIVEVDIGLARAGVEPGAATVALAKEMDGAAQIDFVGIMGYEGHLLILPDLQEKEQRIRAAMAELVKTRDAVLEAGLCCDIVSAGGTGSYATTITCPGITELQAGGLIFMDVFYREKCNVTEFDNALSVLTTVVSRPTEDRAIIDAGRKTHNAEFTKAEVMGRNDIEVVQLSAEHGSLRLEPSAADLRIGDRLQLIPSYSDFTTVLHDRFYGIRNGRLEVVWPLSGRGRLQ